MQIKTKVRYHYIPFRMVNIIKTESNQVLARMGSNWNSYVADGNVKWNSFGKQFESLLKVKHIPVICYSHSTPKYLLKRNESI